MKWGICLFILAMAATLAAGADENSLEEGVVAHEDAVGGAAEVEPGDHAEARPGSVTVCETVRNNGIFVKSGADRSSIQCQDRVTGKFYAVDESLAQSALFTNRQWVFARPSCRGEPPAEGEVLKPMARQLEKAILDLCVDAFRREVFKGLKMETQMPYRKIAARLEGPPLSRLFPDFEPKPGIIRSGMGSIKCVRRQVDTLSY